MPEGNAAERSSAPQPVPASQSNHAASPGSASGASAVATDPAAKVAAPVAGNHAASGAAPAEVDLRWVWMEVRKRVFIKLPFSRQVADVMEAVIPITLDGNQFICGLPPAKFPLSGALIADQVKNTIEGILRQAAGHSIHFEVIEGTGLEDWLEIKQRRERAHNAVVAMAEHNVELHHFEDVLNQVVAEIRHRVTSTRDRNFPQVRARLILDIVPQLSDTVDMLIPEENGHETGRILARTIDRVSSFLDLPTLSLAMEIERYHREQVKARQTPARAPLDSVESRSNSQDSTPDKDAVAPSI